jgi:hypothetical protein
MSMTRRAEATAARAAHSRPLKVLARAGFVGYGIVHLLFAWLALQVAFDRPADEGDQSGALRTLAAQPLGKFLVAAIAIGLIAMAIWQAFEAAIGHREERGGSRTLERVGSAGRTVVYLYLAWTCYRVFTDADTSSADKQQAMSAQLMSSTGGRWLIGLIGVGLAALGIGLAGYGVLRRFERHLQTERMSPRIHRLSRRLGVAGYAAKGIAYAIAGLLLFVAAVRYDPGKARGLDAALHALRDRSYGAILLTLVALGFAAFAAFCAVQAKYRKV